MWPFERRATKHVLRVGRLAVEHWLNSDEGLVLQGQAPLPQDRPVRAADWQKALEIAPSSTAAVVLESAWAPVMLVDTGTSLLGKKQVEALAQHHVMSLYAESGESAADWDFRVEHRAGDRHALVFALRRQTRADLLGAAQAVGPRLTGLVPAFDWGLAQLSPGASAWVVWVEQDRQMVGRVRSGRFVGLHPAMPCVDTPARVLNQIAAEEVRAGLKAGLEGIWVGHWGARRGIVAGERRLTWHGLAAGDRVEQPLAAEPAANAEQVLT